MDCRTPCTLATRSTVLIGAVLPVASRKRVIVRFTGRPTSTFGGGGGTKLFCSQPLNATNTNMAKTIREAAAMRLVLPLGWMHAGEREGFIPMPQLFCAREGVLRKACRGRRIATIR